jgi:hypothetical protein
LHPHELMWGSGVPALLVPCAILFVVCALLWNIAVVLYLLEKRGNKAEQRASTLLNEWLTLEQRVQYKRLGYFEVRGSDSGKRYRIRSGRQMNVDQLDQHGHRVAVLCFLPEKYVPVSDVMLAQKIMLENDEPAALSVAGRRADSYHGR